jgi:hypothetical protein
MYVATSDVVEQDDAPAGTLTMQHVNDAETRGWNAGRKAVLDAGGQVPTR